MKIHLSSSICGKKNSHEMLWQKIVSTKSLKINGLASLSQNVLILHYI